MHEFCYENVKDPRYFSDNRVPTLRSPVLCLCSGYGAEGGKLQGEPEWTVEIPLCKKLSEHHSWI